MMNEFLKRAVSGIFIILWIFLTILYSSPLFIISMILCLLIIALFEWPTLAKNFQPLFFIYPAIPFILIIYLQLYGYKMLNFFTFGASFIFDTSAYVWGKLFGKHKIAPSISPGKTIEGSLGGSITLIIIYFTYIKFGTTLPAQPLRSLGNLFIPLMVSILAFAGDLFESYLKRQSGLKDSGNALPGHGGLLDRFDSILFVVVFVFLFRNYLSSILQIN